VAATVAVAGARLRVWNLHLDTRINLGERLEQLRPVADAARKEPIETVVIGGDFNTNPYRWLFRRVPVFPSGQAGAVDDFMKEHGFETPLAEAGSTTHRGPLRMRLDTIYLRGLKAADWNVEKSVKSSDHFPLWVEVAWPPAAEAAAKAE
jgi:endonuclease/exonuclease/phosphatase family metal-dependent hydrolase